MAKDRSGKIPEKTRTEQPALENDRVRKRDRRRQTTRERSSGFGVENDPAPVIWFLD
jgi:hypothetical protein